MDAGNGVTLRLSVTAPDRGGDTEEAQRLVLRAFEIVGIAHDPGTIRVLALDPIEEFQRDLPGPE